MQAQRSASDCEEASCEASEILFEKREKAKAFFFFYKKKSLLLLLSYLFFNSKDMTLIPGVYISTLSQYLPIQTPGHIQHQYEALSEIHTLTHHRCWRIIHTELGRLASSKWRFICINGEKTFAPSGKN